MVLGPFCDDTERQEKVKKLSRPQALKEAEKVRRHDTQPKMITQNETEILKKACVHL